MSKALTARTRRTRRSANAALKFGKAAKPSHSLVGGRTGSKAIAQRKSAHRGKGAAT